jgi:uncharacterized protein (TIGR03067 family)
VSDEPVTPDKNVALIFTGDRVRMTANGDTQMFSQFKVDASRSPMAIDLLNLDSSQGEAIGMTTLCLIEVHGTTLRLALPIDDGDTRPTSFAVYEKCGYVVFVAEKQ